jgi:MFS family permease
VTAAPALPASYRTWLIAVGASLLGTQVLAFAMAWAAAGFSGLLAGLVLAAITLPRTLLLLVGGAVADSAGPRRVLLTGDAVMLATTAMLAALLLTVGMSPALLLAAALVTGTVDAFYLPASGTLPRLLVPPASLPRAMAARQLVGQAAASTGAPLGGLLVALAGLAAAAVFDAATFALMLGVLLVLGRALPDPPPAAPGGDALWRRALDGVRVVAADRVLRAATLLVVVAAATLIPVPALLVAVLARQRDWPASQTGLVVGAVAVGAAAVFVAVLLRRASSRPGVVGPAGLVLAAAGTAALAAPLRDPGAVAAALAVGAGTGLFTAHVGPVLLERSPPGHVARVQAVLGVAQSLPLMVGNPLLGVLSDLGGAGTVLVGCAAALAAAASTALVTGALVPSPAGDRATPTGRPLRSARDRRAA